MYNYYRQPTSRLYVRAFRNQSRYHKFTRDHTLGMTWRSRNTRKIQVPLVKYGNTVVTLNHKRIYPPISEIGTMKIKPRKGRNVMSVRYRSGHVFQLLNLMMIVSWIVMAGMLIKRYK